MAWVSHMEHESVGDGCKVLTALLYVWEGMYRMNQYAHESAIT